MALVGYVKHLFKTRPLLSNCLTYGTLFVGAEFSQQAVNKHFAKARNEVLEYDFAGIGRCAVLGSSILPSLLFMWYKWLDRTFVGAAAKTVVLKVLLDQCLMTPTSISVFYIGMSTLEFKSDILAEWKQKIGPTYLTSWFFWIPAQAINFALLPPPARVVYVASASFIWINILCWFKRQSM
ncbi:unnamed protein product [Darwinula stevensoni]|uniref:Mpv17-like protein n=1 Tax=Darwinula stevensoni TaxID=69355 RepID=A0A7R8XJS6_9CRUS|nr:unnamed protein product [Darwinula stevensoni]CAG0895089.1 unnamed protein product [Darwinula stevensoni]